MIELDHIIVCSTCESENLDVSSESEFMSGQYSAACRACDCAGSEQGIERMRIIIQQ